MSEAGAGSDRAAQLLSGSAVVVAQHFLPLNVVAAQRALRMVRTLLGRFERVYAMYGDTSIADPALLDHDYGSDVLSDSRLVRIAVRPILTRYGYVSATSRIQRLFGGVATRLLCGPGLDWMRPLHRALSDIPQADEIRLVLATGPPFITFRAAIRFAAARRAPAILDYRDLWTSNPHGRYPAVARSLVNQWIERPLNRAAAIVTTVSQGCRTWLVDNGGSARVWALQTPRTLPTWISTGT